MIVIPSDHAVFMGSAALLGEATSLQAWAERHVRIDPDLRWVLGNYVEADIANSNGHIFPLTELWAAQKTLAGKPLNMLHREHYIVGAFAGAQVVDVEGQAVEDLVAAEEAKPTHVEALAGMWHNRFPEEYFNIQRAHADGELFLSMEAIPESVSCPTCTHETAFAGLSSDTYCDHMQGATGPKVLHKPVFNGGAIILPPVRPGWSGADVRAISKELGGAETVESVYAQVAAEAPHLSPSQWESAMTQLLMVAREFDTDERERLAKNGNALPDGSFPIKNREDVQNAIRAVGRAKNPDAARDHIKRMAKQLGCEDLIPEGW